MSDERIVYQHCPVCGLLNPLEDYDICPCCGFEAYGQEDWPNGANWVNLRKIWVDGGMQWWASPNDERQPKNWNPVAQLATLELEQQVESLRAELAWNQAANDAIWSELVTRGLASEIGPDKLRSLEADSKIHAACEKQLAAEKQRADALEAALKLAISAGEYVVRIVEDCGKSGDSPNPNVKSDWLGTAMHCYAAMSWLNTARDVIDAARKPVPQEPAK